MNLPPCCSRRLLSLKGSRIPSLHRRAVITCDLAGSQPSCSRTLSSQIEAYPRKHGRPTLPRLSLDFVLPFGPSKDSRSPLDSSPRQRAHVISRLLSLLERPVSVADEVFAAYSEVLSLPRGETLLSPQEVGLVIDKLITPKRRVGIATRTAFERVTLVLEGVSRARETLLRSSSRSHEAAEWESLLRSTRLQNDMVRLIRDSHRTRGTDELHQVLDVLRKSFQWEEGSTELDQAGTDRNAHTSRRRLAARHRNTASTDRVRHNMVLELISRIAQQPTLRNVGRNSDQTLANKTITSRLVQELPLKRLVTSTLSRQETSNSLEDMSQLYYALWNDMNAFDDLSPDAFAWSTRLRLEGKIMLQELFAALSDFPKGRTVRSLDEVWDKSLAFRGWTSIQASLKEALSTGALHSSHVHQVLWLFCHARLAVKKVTAKGGDDVLSAVMTRFLGFDADAVDAVSELYETLRWNEVQLEMGKLRLSRSSDESKSIPPSPVNSMFSGGRNGVGETTKDTCSGPIATLLGIPVPDQMVTTDITFSMLIRYYAAIEGDYDKGFEVLEDFKQAGQEVVEPSSANSSSTSAPRQLPMAILDSFFRAFAVHGVASEESEEGQWDIADAPSPAASTAVPVSGWRLENLLPFLDALLHRTAPKLQARQIEQEKYERVSSMLSLGPTEEGEDEALRDLLFPTSISTSTSASSSSNRTDGSAATSYSAQIQTQAPTPRQLFTVLTALRRCTGDARPDVVLRYWRALQAKYGFPLEQGAQTQPQPQPRVQVQQGDVEVGVAGRGGVVREGGEAEVETGAGARRLAQATIRAAGEAGLTTEQVAARQQQQQQQDAEHGAQREHDRQQDRTQEGRDEGEGKGEDHRLHNRGAEEDSDLGAHRVERVNGQGWTGWRMDNRLKRLIPFLEGQEIKMRRERGEEGEE
ncbi:hypothetical protein BCV69DRAFT_282271 [Microstroma glucosiphilum]|uniref:Uncharacterized protein n=1 Tax=Pseudomicrostroma glucosiphilum TaxID=1684307 RepID=A0A316U8R4_9BASI|nr:hypothetical protein BCV69DRAFT_282271 [Pseudomicrostroma glucosiphilum]PWN21552.1 hypothetical protein BCV69DRAFT_282271 [Pseudomicrostroma glucosiphilum]